jgi:hypothetical protein
VKFKSKHDAMNKRQHLWCCLSCNTTWSTMTHSCDRCHTETQYFASKAEYRRYQALRVELQAGSISQLTLQPVYRIVINGQPICKYIADFRYIRDGEIIVSDVKGSRDPKYHDPVFKLKKKLVEAVHGIEIHITT